MWSPRLMVAGHFNPVVFNPSFSTTNTLLNPRPLWDWKVWVWKFQGWNLQYLLQSGHLNPELFNFELGWKSSWLKIWVFKVCGWKAGVERSWVGKFRVEEFGVEEFGFEEFGVEKFGGEKFGIVMTCKLQTFISMIHNLHIWFKALTLFVAQLIMNK